MFFVKLTLTLIAVLPIASQAAALYDAHKQQWTQMNEMADQIRAGDTLIIGEIHDHPVHHRNQFLLMTKLWEKGLRVSLGMEFFEYPYQPILDQYLSGELAESEFLKQIGWGGTPYQWYRMQVLFPLQMQGSTYAINAPRSLTSKVARSGLDSLDEKEALLLPPDFQLGNDLYFRRFSDVMGEHVPEEALHRYFAAQSLWDDTMAWQSLKAQEKDTADVFIIIVGDFHASFGGGLPDRLRARGAGPVKVISQIDSTGMSDGDVRRAVEPHPFYGKRADWIWLTEREDGK